MLFLLKHDQNRVYGRNLRLIQELMHLNDPANSNFKQVFAYFLNISVLTNSVTQAGFQVRYVHASIWNKSLRVNVNTFALAGSPEAEDVVSTDAKRALARARENIILPTTEFLLCDAISDLSGSKKLCDWAVLNSVLLPPFLTDPVVLEGETEVAELRRTFTVKIFEQELEYASDESD